MVPGRFPADDDVRECDQRDPRRVRPRRPRRFIPDEFNGAFSGKFVTPANISNTHAASPPRVGHRPAGDGRRPGPLQHLPRDRDRAEPQHGLDGESDGELAGGQHGPWSNAAWGFKDDYIAHHEPFQYYASTANPHHLSVSRDTVGHDLPRAGAACRASVMTHSRSPAVTARGPQFDTPNQNDDTSDFDALVAAINSGKLPPNALPAVTFLKAPGYEDGHALVLRTRRDEQAFIVKEVNGSRGSRPTGRARRSSSTTTTRTAGTTTSDSGVTNPSTTPLPTT